MRPPSLQRHKNGVYYIHWNEGRRSKRISTKHNCDLKATQAFGEWILHRYGPLPKPFDRRAGK